MGSRVDVLGVLIHRVGLSQVEEMLDRFAASGKPHQLVTVNLDFISRSLRDPGFRELVNSSSLVVPDGMPVLWAASFLGDPLPQRITGMDLVHSGCRLAQRSGQGVFLLGETPEVAADAASALRQLYPELRISSLHSPPFRPFSRQENDKIVDLVAVSGARYLFVALGSPRQEYWIRDNLPRLGAMVAVGVGGIFKCLAGRVKRAPVWVQNLGGEWLVRMAQQPRLARRYFVDDLPVLFKVVSHRYARDRAARPHRGKKAA